MGHFQKPLRLTAMISAIILAALAGLHPALAEPVTLTTADSVAVFGEYYGTGDKSRPLILLFHMAESNRGEYETIAPRLNALGFNALAIDQRAGGRLWGRDNATVRKLGRSTGFTEALPDIEAAIAYAKSSGHSGKLILMGSSYSASLVFAAAAKHPDEVAAVLSFSPGEYFGPRLNVGAAAARLHVPVFVTSADDAGEIGAARAIIAGVKGPKTQFIPKAGNHGASTLREDRNRAGAAENWRAVEAFLTGLK